MNNNDFLIELSNMVKNLKKLEKELDEDNWTNEDKIYDYNELIDNILIFLKERL